MDFKEDELLSSEEYDQLPATRENMLNIFRDSISPNGKLIIPNKFYDDIDINGGYNESNVTSRFNQIMSLDTRILDYLELTPRKGD